MGPEAPPTKNQNPFSSSLASRAAMDRRLKAVVAQLGELAAAAMRPGARPPAIPEIPADLLEAPAVRKAVTLARHAAQDAERRVADRAAKQAATLRSAEFRAAAAGPFPWSWWTKHRAALDAEFDAREQEPGLDRYALAAIRASREATFAARWRLWKKVTGPQSIPVMAPVVVSAADRRREDETEFEAELDRVFGIDSRPKILVH